jgi:hypothetical protein
VRIGLSQAGKLDVTAMDISPHVISHLAAARRRANRGTPYVVQLPRDLNSSWKPGTIAFWEQFGRQMRTMKDGYPLLQTRRLPDILVS